MLKSIRTAFVIAAATALIVPAACAQMQPAAPLQETPTTMSSQAFHPNSIQPETTIVINAEASEERAPDIAFITTGVEARAKTASEAMSAQSTAMNAVFDTLKKAGIEQRDMQTSGLSLNANYDYVEVEEGRGRTRNEQVLSGYTASNRLTVKIRDLSSLGGTLDSLVSAGGNTFSGLRFANEDAETIRDEARKQAIKNAVTRAELYADAAGLNVGRIVSITEGRVSAPREMNDAPMMRMSASAPTPIAGGEVGYSVNVTVLFELVK